MKRIDGCRRLLETRKEESPAAEGFAKKTVETECGFSVSGAVLYKKLGLMVLWKRMTIGLSQNVLISSQDVPEHVEHPLAALDGRDTKKRVRERVTGSVRRDV